MNDMLSFIYLASLFAVGGAAFSLMWKNISDIKNEQFNKYNARPHPEAPKEGEERLDWNKNSRTITRFVSVVTRTH